MMSVSFEVGFVPNRARTGRWYREGKNIVVVLDGSIVPARRRPSFEGELAEVALDKCRSGEGPPAAVPDPEGRGLHPLVYRGATPKRSRNPTVGDAQILLNNFLASLNSTFSTCRFAQPSGLERARRLLAELNAAGENPLVVDCRFGPNTERATKLFQLCKGIADDGKIGPVTWPLLEAFRRRVPVPPIPPVPIPVSILNPARWAPILSGARTTSARVEPGNAVKFLIDGATTFRDMVASIRRATSREHYIYILGWILIDHFELIPGDPSTTMRQLLTDAAGRGVQIRVMLWEQPAIDPKLLAENSGAVDRINRLGTGAAILDNETLLKTALIKTGSHHQKVLVVQNGDGLVAYCGGIDANTDRIRAIGGEGASSGSSGGAGSPLHDVHCRMVGPAAFDLLHTFIKRWDHHPDSRSKDARKGALIGRSTTRPAPRASVSSATSSIDRTCSVAIARTILPVHAAPGVRRECDIRALLLASIAAAKRFIYMEEQYLVSQEAARALNAAVPRLNHVTILISASEIADDLRCPWEIRKNFIKTLTAGLSRSDLAKVRVFHLVTPNTSGSRRFGAHTYVHAKTWVFDDELAVIGSANCNKRGWETDSEVDAFIFDDAAAIARTPISNGSPTFAQAMRMQLWAEHLNMPASRLADGVASASHWLSPPSGARIERYNPTADTDSRLTVCLRDVVDPGAPCP